MIGEIDPEVLSCTKSRRRRGLRSKLWQTRKKNLSRLARAVSRTSAPAALAAGAAGTSGRQAGCVPTGTTGTARYAAAGAEAAVAAVADQQSAVGMFGGAVADEHDRSGCSGRESDM